MNDRCITDGCNAQRADLTDFCERCLQKRDRARRAEQARGQSRFKNMGASYDPERLGGEDKSALIRFFMFRLGPELRRELICEMPMVYNRLHGGPIALVVRVEDGQDF